MEMEGGQGIGQQRPPVYCQMQVVNDRSPTAFSRAARTVQTLGMSRDPQGPVAPAYEANQSFVGGGVDTQLSLSHSSETTWLGCWRSTTKPGACGLPLQPQDRSPRPRSIFVIVAPFVRAPWPWQARDNAHQGGLPFLCNESGPALSRSGNGWSTPPTAPFRPKRPPPLWVTTLEGILRVQVLDDRVGRGLFRRMSGWGQGLGQGIGPSLVSSAKCMSSEANRTSRTSISMTSGKWM